MPTPTKFSNPNEIVRFISEQAAQFAPVEVSSQVKDRLAKTQTYDELIDGLKTEGKMEEDLAQHVGSSMLYAALEKAGVDPKEWQFTVKPIERGNVKYGPDEFEEARKFLGSWTAVGELALLVASVASIGVATIGTILTTGALVAIKTAIRRGATRIAISNLLNIEKLRAIKWLSVPALIAALGTAWTWLSSVQLTATGDLQTYLKQGVARGEELIRQAEQKAAAARAEPSAGLPTQPRTIIRMALTSKPQLFTGILFAAPLSKAEAFSRHLDDEITDLGDLQNDLKLNLASWIKGLPGRVSVAIAVRNNPIVSQSEKLSGTWIVASLSYNLIDGGRVFLDSIPLGPINPVKYMPRVSEVRTLENQVFGEFKPETIRELVIPPSAMTALTKEGELVPILPTAAAPAATAIPVPATPPVKTQEEFREAGLPVPPGTPTAAAVAAAAAAAAAPPPAAAVKKAKFAVDQRARVNDPEGLNVRSFAGTAGTKLFAIPIGTEVRIGSEPQFRDGFEWYSIVVQSGQFNGRGGFAAGEFLT